MELPIVNDRTNLLFLASMHSVQLMGTRNYFSKLSNTKEHSTVCPLSLLVSVLPSTKTHPLRGTFSIHLSCFVVASFYANVINYARCGERESRQQQ
eukprot:scaffold1051_cov119-Cylindrotheca_fusiformis.AAC.8